MHLKVPTYVNIKNGESSYEFEILQYLFQKLYPKKETHKAQNAPPNQRICNSTANNLGKEANNRITQTCT